MAYPNYNPYYQPYQNYQIQQPQQVAPAQQGMIWVAGLTEASNYPVCPNAAVNLWDSTAPCVYVKSADATGKPSMKIYDLVERTQQAQVQPAPTADYVTRAEFEKLVSRVEQIVPKKTKKEDSE